MAKKRRNIKRKAKPRTLILGSTRKPESAKAVEKLLPGLKRYANIVDIIFAEGLDLSKLEADIVIVFGGDGTMLSAARMLNGNVAPVLGVNMGHRGFLTQSSVDSLLKDFKAFLDGKLIIGRRVMLSIALKRAGKTVNKWKALNDVVVSTFQFARMVRLKLSINGMFVHEYPCDGLIISTPTGSTAHALSAGGPILSPESRSLVVVPIASHAFVDRPIVIPSNRYLNVELGRETKNSIITVDGQADMSMIKGDMLEVKRSPHDFQIVEVGNDSFYDVVRRKLSWGG